MAPAGPAVRGGGWAPDRGDVVWIDHDPHAGREQAGRRPALVLSPVDYNRKVGLAIMCPVTSQAKGYPYEVAIPSSHPVWGVILSDHVKSLDWRARNASHGCTLPPATIEDVLAKLQTLLD